MWQYKLQCRVNLGKFEYQDSNHSLGPAYTVTTMLPVRSNRYQIQHACFDTGDLLALILQIDVVVCNEIDTFLQLRSEMMTIFPFGPSN